MPIKSGNVIPKMTSNTVPLGIASASSVYSSAFDPWYAFNQISDQGWASNGTTTEQWLCYKFANPVAISQYTITSRNSTVSTDLQQSPKKWRFEASNDASNWITIDERDNVTNWGVAEKRVFSFNNNINFLYYRIYCISNNGSTLAFAINELEMMEYDFFNKFLISAGDKYYSLTDRYLDNVIPAMTSNTSPSGIAEASSFYSTFYPWKAFDRVNDQNGWVTDINILTGWLSYEFDLPKIISAYSIQAGNTPVGRPPKSWTFEGWTGTEWKVLDEKVNQPVFNSSEFRFYSFKNKEKFKKYRINVTANQGAGDFLAIGDLGMYELEKYILEVDNKEINYINNGMNKKFIIDLEKEFNERRFLVENKTQLDSGKIFKQKINTSKISIIKVSIT